MPALRRAKPIFAAYPSHEMVGKRTKNQAMLITALLAAIYEIGFRTNEEVKIRDKRYSGVCELVSYYTNTCTITLIEGETPLRDREAIYGLPFHDPAEWSRWFYEYWVRSVDDMADSPQMNYTKPDANRIIAMAVLKNCLQRFNGQVVAFKRADHGIAFLVHPLVDGYETFRIDVSLW